MVTILVHRNGKTEQVTSIDRAWLNPASGALLWVDLAAPSIPESLILSDTFGFHPLSVEDAMSPRQYPKVEAHDGDSRSIVDLREHATRNAKILGEGPVALFHRIVDAMVDHYRPEIEKLED